jgi:6-phosphogluconolactonase
VSVELEIVEDPAAVCAGLLVDAAAAGGQIVLAGGSTPRAAYAHAAEDRAAWTRATLWFGDERCVPPDDERSNYAMVKATLLDELPANTEPAVRRIEGERGPAAAADAYEQLLQAPRRPQFDLVLLGLGSDGHTASLFPDQPALAERERLAVGVAHPGLAPFVPRVTLTLPALAAARRVVFLAVGSGKADAVARAFGPHSKPDPRVPASLLAPLARAVVVLLDHAAAGAIA